uniref:Dynein heavy chain AAA module D4 domain-containing protein n=1 Tax=Eptatretus burgeri TaxID=7764 RepID=A0A8C4NGX1_EPTBU
MFPSLINCCTIDWFHVWPSDALEMVANNFLEDMDIDPSILREVVSVCKYFHQSTIRVSEKYHSILRRRNYVTPTSYLELILTYKSLLNGKREEVSLKRNRYALGLEKLAFAASQVRSSMTSRDALGIPAGVVELNSNRRLREDVVSSFFLSFFLSFQQLQSQTFLHFLDIPLPICHGTY